MFESEKNTYDFLVFFCQALLVLAVGQKADHMFLKHQANKHHSSISMSLK